jgi:integral membrane protein (TIGR00529 family)
MFDLLNAIPAFCRILIIFTLILLLIKRKWTLGNAFLTSSAGLGLIFGMRPLPIIQSAGAAMVHPKTLSLSVVVSLILVLSHSLEKSGQMTRLLEGFKGLIRWPKVNMVIFPALIGLLPMPGGAIFSAPMVKNLGDDYGLSGSQLSYINYWFRHIWEYWWPLYPGILLTTALAEVDLWHLVFFTLPLTVVAVAAGYWPLRGAMVGSQKVVVRHAIGPFFKELAPILFVIGLGLALGNVMSVILPDTMSAITKELGLIVALLLAIVWVWRGNSMSWPVCWMIIRQPALLKMIYMVTAILIFKGVLEDSGAVKLVSQEMLRWHIPLMPIAMLLPFLVGLVAGITIAFVGTTFPILISLIHSLGQSHLLLPFLMLALASGFVGVLLSPLHLCLLLSNEYFQTSLIPVYRHMRLPIGSLLLAGSLYFSALRYFMG